MKPYYTSALVVGGVAAAAALVLLARRGAVKARPGAANPTNAASHRAARPIVAAALKGLLGREPTLAELQYGQAIAWLETNYGRGWKGAMVGSNNWGAVQCAKGSTQPCISYEDSYADGTKYTVSFRSYASAEEGAADMLRHVFKLRPITAGVLHSGDGTTVRASYAMRRERYYEGFCPKATKQYGAAAVRPSLATPDKSDATKACAREAIESHGGRADDIISQIAGSLGEPMAMPAGTYDDADAWYRGRAGTVAGEAPPAPHPLPIPRGLLEVRP
jgi:hypothetical protein